MYKIKYKHRGKVGLSPKTFRTKDNAQRAINSIRKSKKKWNRDYQMLKIVHAKTRRKSHHKRRQIGLFGMGRGDFW